MQAAFTVACLVPAAVSAGCCTATRRPDPLVWAGTGLMLLSMIDTMVLGSTMFSPYVWAAVLVTCAVGLAAGRSRQALAWERSCHLTVMAALEAAMGLV